MLRVLGRLPLMDGVACSGGRRRRSLRGGNRGGLRITGSLRGSRTVVMPTCASSRPRVTVKKKRKAETAAFMLVAEAPLDFMCS